MCWHFGICLEARNQQSITFHLALYFSFLLLLLCNNGLRIQQREALDLPAAWPCTFASWHDSHCSILPWAFSLDQGSALGMRMLWDAAAVKSWECVCCSAPWAALSPYCLFTCLPQGKGPTKYLCCLWSLLLLCCFFRQRPACDCVCFIHLSILLWGCFCLECKPVLSWDTWWSADLISLLLLQIIGTRTCCFYKQSLSLDICLLPESLLFPDSLSFPIVVLGQMNIPLSAANWVWFFGGQGDILMHLYLLVQNSVLYSTLYFSSLPFFFIPLFPLPFLADG